MPPKQASPKVGSPTPGKASGSPLVKAGAASGGAGLGQRAVARPINPGQNAGASSKIGSPSGPLPSSNGRPGSPNVQAMGSSANRPGSPIVPAPRKSVSKATAPKATPKPPPKTAGQRSSSVLELLDDSSGDEEKSTTLAAALVPPNGSGNSNNNSGGSNSSSNNGGDSGSSGSNAGNVGASAATSVGKSKERERLGAQTVPGLESRSRPGSIASPPLEQQKHFATLGSTIDTLKGSDEHSNASPAESPTATGTASGPLGSSPTGSPMATTIVATDREGGGAAAATAATAATATAAGAAAGVDNGSGSLLTPPMIPSVSQATSVASDADANMGSPTSSPSHPDETLQTLQDENARLRTELEERRASEEAAKRDLRVARQKMHMMQEDLKEKVNMAELEKSLRSQVETAIVEERKRHSQAVAALKAAVEAAEQAQRSSSSSHRAQLLKIEEDLVRRDQQWRDEVQQLWAEMMRQGSCRPVASYSK